MTENEGADYLRLVGMSFATPWTAAHQAPPFFTVSWSLFKIHINWISDAI